MAAIVAKATQLKELHRETKARCETLDAEDRMASRRCCARIPKTIVYMESIAHIEVAVQRLINWLVRAGCSKVIATNAIKAYHSELAEFDKRAISNEFKKFDSLHQIILATDAMGMGINNPDVFRVVQYHQPKNMSSLWQRAGRAAHGPGASGEFI